MTESCWKRYLSFVLFLPPDFDDFSVVFILKKSSMTYISYQFCERFMILVQRQTIFLKSAKMIELSSDINLCL